LLRLDDTINLGYRRRFNYIFHSNDLNNSENGVRLKITRGPYLS